MSIFGLELNLTIVSLIAGVFVGWHFPQPAWVSASIAAAKTWLSSFRKK
jgi:hypothetical protein